MPVIQSAVDAGSADYRANREAMLARLAAVASEQERAVAGGGERYVARHRERGRLLVRERIELLLDRDSAFLELSSLAAWGTEFHVGAALVTGVGVVEGVECVVIGNDPTVRGGSINPYTLRKNLRALEIARRNRLPVINLTESGGADLPTQADLFIPAGEIFRDLTRLSAMRVPTISLVFGNSTAGGAYMPGMCDHAVMVDKAAKVFLGGPPLVKMATGEESDDEELGGADMHARVSGLADYFAVDELDCIRLGRQIVADLNWRKLGPGPTKPSREPRYDPDEMLGVVSADLRVPFDPREVIARVVDGSEFDEYKERYGTSLVTGWASIHGYPVGVLANARGVLFMDESKKATEFILLANETSTPLVFLQNTTGYMVGRQYEQAGMIKDGAKMINAVANSGVPMLTVIMGASYGAGNYGMCGRAYEPRFLFTWPSARVAVMGPQQLAGVLSIVARQSAEASGRAFDEAADADQRRSVEEQIERESEALFMTGKLYDDGIIDPRETRTVLGLSLSAVHSAPVEGRAGFGVFPDVIRNLLIANRGEIARRITRTAREMGIRTTAVFSDPDARAPFAREADVAVHLPGASPAETYLNIPRIIDAARAVGADAVHPGYGFLSENAAFARACAAAGLTFVGPRPETIEQMGSKVAAKQLMARAGVPVLPSVELDGQGGSTRDPGLGFPLLVKATFGGGGRGMRVVREPAELAEAVASARREAESAFGDASVFAERYVEDPRHVEVQIFGDTHGTVVHLFERECSIQRRYQKVIEESPSPAVTPPLRKELGDAAVAAAGALGYVGAGTVEFVLEPDGRFWFLEVNTRLQVEHPVTELVTGLDLVRLQLLVADGQPLPAEARQAAISGHAIEARLYAEDVAAGYLPASGTLERFDVPTGDGARVDSGVESGSVVGTNYDALLAKVIAWAPAREAAAATLAGHLAAATIVGVITNRELLVRVLRDPEFLAGHTDTGFLARRDPVELAAPLADGDARARHALANAIAAAAARRAAAPVQREVPSGWRNVPSAPQQARYRDASGEVDVRYRIGGGGRVDATVDGAVIAATVRFAGADAVDMEVGGVRRRYLVASDAVSGPDGSSMFTEVPRFPLPGSADAPGSLLAPMPGTVARVAVRTGDHVGAGDALVVVEAMKMEHAVRAPHEGTVTEVRVTEGQQVDTGDVLAIVAAG